MSSGPNRWKVQRARDFTGGLHLDGEWGALIAGDTRFREIFDTHAEALAYADRQARTITVTLPMPSKVQKITTDRPDRRADMTIDATPDGVVLSRPAQQPWKRKWRTNDQSAYIPNSQLEEVAATLLAYARRKDTTDE